MTLDTREQSTRQPRMMSAGMIDLRSAVAVIDSRVRPKFHPPIVIDGTQSQHFYSFSPHPCSHKQMESCDPIPTATITRGDNRAASRVSHNTLLTLLWPQRSKALNSVTNQKIHRGFDLRYRCGVAGILHISHGTVQLGLSNGGINVK